MEIETGGLVAAISGMGLMLLGLMQYMGGTQRNHFKELQETKDTYFTEHEKRLQAENEVRNLRDELKRIRASAREAIRKLKDRINLIEADNRRLKDELVKLNSKKPVNE